MSARVGLIVNPSAGGGRAATAAATAADRLTQLGLEVVSTDSRAPQGAAAAVREMAPRVDIVVAVGGDGTINEVINGLVGTNLPLGIVPAGTVNVLALELRLPFDVERACDIIAGGHRAVMDLGLVDGRYFALMVGAGIDALTIRELDPRAKQRYKKVAFVLTGLRAALHFPAPDFRVTVDGRELEASFVVVGNSHYYAGRFGITSRADPADGLLDVVVFRGKGIVRAALFWLGTPFGLHVRRHDVTYVQGKHIDMKTLRKEDEVWYQADGELIGRLPASIEVVPRALEVLVA